MVLKFSLMERKLATSGESGEGLWLGKSSVLLCEGRVEGTIVKGGRTGLRCEGVHAPGEDSGERRVAPSAAVEDMDSDMFV